MKRRLISLFLAGVLFIPNISLALWSEVDLLSEPKYCQPYKTVLVGDEDKGPISIYMIYSYCKGHEKKSECSKKSPVVVGEFSEPKGMLDFNIRIDDSRIVDTSKLYYEQGVTIKNESDFHFEKSVTEDDVKDISYDRISYAGGPYTSYVDTYRSTIEDGGLKLDDSTIVDYSQIELPNSMGIHSLSYEIKEKIDFMREIDKYDKEGNKESHDVEEWTNKSTRWVGNAEKFYVGPYPTIQYNATLSDNNQDSHIDTLDIRNIKMTCTYKPDSVDFELHNSSGHIMTFEDIPVTSVKPRADGLGYNVEVKAINQELWNINPLDNHYLKVLVNDGRTGTPNSAIPEAPKYAKFGYVGF